MPGTLTATQLFTTAQLLGVQTRDRIKFAPIFLTKFFNTELAFATKKIFFEEIFKNKKLAPFCSPFVDGRVHRNKGAVINSFEPPYVKSKHIVDPERLIERTPGEAILGSLTPEMRRQAAIAANTVEEEEEIIRRLEWMCVQLTLTGKVVCEGEESESLEIDYGRDDANIITLAGAAKWDSVDIDTYDPTDDINEWVLNSSGVVSEIYMDRKAWSKFYKFKAVKDNLDTTSRGSTSSLELGPQLASVFQYKGNFGAFDIYVVDHRYENAAGENTPFMPDNTILFCGPYDGKLAYGAIQDGKAIREGAFQGSRFAKHWIETGDVEKEYTKRECAPCPVTLDPNFFVTVKVA